MPKSRTVLAGLFLALAEWNSAGATHFDPLDSFGGGGPFLYQALHTVRAEVVTLPLTNRADSQLRNGTVTNHAMVRFGNGLFPYAAWDTNRNLLLLHPLTNRAAVLTFVAPSAGTYRVTGDFARANDFRAAGDGVETMIYKNSDRIYFREISSDFVVNASAPFLGQSRGGFRFEVELTDADKLHFAVAAGSKQDMSFDVTALRLSIDPGDLSNAFTFSGAVPGTANIFGAGLLTPPQPAGSGAGTRPPVIQFRPGPENLFSFSSTGRVSMYIGNGYNGPDGSGGFFAPTDITSYGGVSGIRCDTVMFLAGVFLPNTNLLTAPSRLDFSGTGLARAYAHISPKLGQTFFIGDGMAGTRPPLPQFVWAPTNASRLYLGFVDGRDVKGAPGYYGDNLGELVVETSLLPVAHVRPLLQLSLVPGSGQLRVNGAPGLPYRLEISTDLRASNWAEWTTVSLTTNSLVFPLDLGAGGPSAFFRAVLAWAAQ